MPGSEPPCEYVVKGDSLVSELCATLCTAHQVARGCRGEAFVFLNPSGEELPTDSKLDNWVGGEARLDLFAVVSVRHGAAKIGRANQDREATFGLSDAWYPSHKQTDKGMSTFLSALWVLSARPTVAKEKLVQCFFEMTHGFSPAASALAALCETSDLSDGYKSALSESIYVLLRKLVPQRKVEKTFEFTRECLGLALTWAPSVTLAVDFIPLVCPFSHERLEDPVTVPDYARVCSRASIKAHMPGGAKYVPGMSKFSTLVEADLVSSERYRLLLALHSKASAVVLRMEGAAAPDSEHLTDTLMRISSAWPPKIQPLMAMVSPLCLRGAEKPCLTWDEGTHCSVFHGMEACGSGYDLFRPLQGKSNPVDAQVLAQKLDQSDLKMDAADGMEREVKESVMVVVDVSQSMQGATFGRGDSRQDDPDPRTMDLTSPPSEAAMAAELEKLRTHPCILALCYMYWKHSGAIVNELGSVSTNPLLRYIVSRQRHRVVAVLEGTKVTKLDDAFPRTEVQIFVKAEDRTIVLSVTLNETIASCKQKLYNQKKTIIPAILQRLSLFGGRQLSDNERLSQAGVAENSTICLTGFAQQRSSLPVKSVEISDNKMTLTVNKGERYMGKVEVHTNQTVVELQFKIWASGIGPFPLHHRLWADFRTGGDGWMVGNLLEDDNCVGANFSDGDSVWIGSRGSTELDAHKMTRISSVQQLFDSLTNRSVAYDFPTELGLITFGDKVTIECELTPMLEKFKGKLKRVQCQGDTKLFDALQMAATSLTARAPESKDRSLRIICLTDGEDTSSTADAFSVVQTLQKAGIKLDAIMIGDGRDNMRELHAIAKATQGYAFAPDSVESALRICELETLLFSPLRPNPPRLQRVMFSHELEAFARVPLDECSTQHVPPQRKPEALSSKVTSVDDALKAASEQPQRTTRSQAATRPAGDRELAPQLTQRLLMELRSLSKKPHMNFDVYPCEDDISFWRVVMEGPTDDGSCPYTGGCWILYVEFPSTFPRTAPEVRFSTPMRHCNVNPTGRVCHSILGRDWAPQTSMLTVFNCLFGLLLVPDHNDALDSNLAMKYHGDREQYEAAIVEATEEARKKNRRQLKKMLGVE